MIKFIFSLMVAVCGGSMYAQAVEGPWTNADEMKARLISSQASIGDVDTIDTALEIRLSPGWHSYWRSPGDSGLPPRFNWDNSENIEQAKVFFPAPKRFDELGLTTFGYDGDLMLPMEISLKEPNKDAKLNMRLDTMVCKDICIPQTLDLTMVIPAGDGAPSKNIRLIDFAKTKIPQAEETSNLKIENITVGPDAIVVNAYSQRGFDNSDIFVEVGEYSLTSKPDFEVPSDDDRRSMIVVPVSDLIKDEYGSGDIPYAGVDITVTLTNGRDAVEQTIVIK